MPSTYSEPPPVSKRPRDGRVCVDIVIDALSEHMLWTNMALEVEQGGVFVATYRQLSVGTIVELHLTLPGEKDAVTVSGVVRWTRPHLEGSDGVAGVGIKFVDLAADVRDKLARFASSVREPLLFELDDAPMRKRRSA